jgi:putative transposase
MAKDFKEFIRIAGMTHVRTSPYYPQSNGKIERWHKSLRRECIRPGTPAVCRRCQAPAPKVCGSLQYSALHSVIGYVTPQDMLAGRRAEIHTARDHKLEEARRQRQLRRQAA